MGFDLGVFLTVVGAVMLALHSLSSMARRRGETVNIYPMDIDPERDDPARPGPAHGADHDDHGKEH